MAGGLLSGRRSPAPDHASGAASSQLIRMATRIGRAEPGWARLAAIASVGRAGAIGLDDASGPFFKALK